MNDIIKKLEPMSVFGIFSELCDIPHGSGNVFEISAYCVDFATKHGLKHKSDNCGNVIIFKPAAPGCEDKEPVILQAHLDMVCEKADGKTIDFKTEPIKLLVNGDFITADGTTLGADDGIGVALILDILADKKAVHPPIEAVFTVDEETGMGGAAALDYSHLSGKRMINLDSEDEGVFVVSCAGGVRTDIKIPVKHHIVNTNHAVNLTISGLLGGHSGSDIALGRLNAIIAASDFLSLLADKTDFSVAAFSADGKDNVIPATVKTALAINDFELLKKAAADYEKKLKNDYPSETGLKIEIVDNGETAASVLTESSFSNILAFLKTLPNGVIAMNETLRGLVKTSLNIGTVHLDSASFKATHLIRSSDNSEKIRLVASLEKNALKAGGKIKLSGDYPGWEYNENSPLTTVMTKCFEAQYGKKPKIEAIHAGLECGIFYGNIPELDCVSMGPEISDIHTPNESLSRSSVERTYKLLKSILSEL